MSEQGSTMVEQMADGSPNEKPAKKLKQLRLPFAPIQKNLGESSVSKVSSLQDNEDDGSGKKRKHSEDEECVIKKLALEFPDSAKESHTSKENGLSEEELSKLDLKEADKKRKSGGKPNEFDTKFSTTNGKGSSKTALKKSRSSANHISIVPLKEDSSQSSKTMSSEKGLYEPKSCVGNESHEEFTANSKEELKQGTPKEKTESTGAKNDSSSDQNSEYPKTPLSRSSSNPYGSNPESPAVLDHLKHKLKVEIAKTVVQVLELKAQLEKAVADQEFLKAQEINEKLKELQKTKEEMSVSLEAGDAENLRALLTPKNSNLEILPASPSTATCNLASPSRKRVAVTVKTPGSASPLVEPVQKIKRLTPKQVAARAEIEKRKDEREKQRLEMKKSKEEEKLKRDAEKREKEKERLMKKAEEENLKKLREEEKERQRIEREKQKEQERKEKEESKRLKEIEKIERVKQKEIEKEQKEVEKKQQEAIEKKKTEKVSQSFINFFVKKDFGKQNELSEEAVSTSNTFAQFRIKKDMRVAPILRNKLNETCLAHLDDYLKGEEKSTTLNLYLQELKLGQRKVLKSGRTWPLTDVLNKKALDENEVEIIEEDEDEEDDVGDEVVVVQADKMVLQKQTMRAKLIQFHDNKRPPYWGTWSKKSSVVGPRKPFGMDLHFFDYDYESDDDWEEEEQGESLSDEEKDKEEEDDEENDKAENNDEDEDDGFFVGHGVLGKDELHPGDDSDECEFDAELEMKKQKLRAQEFENEYKKKKTAKLKPRVYGPLFLNDPKEMRPQIVIDQLLKIFSKIKAVPLCLSKSIPTSISHPTAPPSGGSGSGEVGEPHSSNLANGNSANSNKKAKTVPDESIPDLIKLIHANVNNKLFLAKEFVEFWKKKTDPNSDGSGMKLPQSKVISKIQEIADYQKAGVLMNKGCWIVKQDWLSKYQIDKVDVPNTWEYLLEVPSRITQTPVTPNEANVETEKGSGSTGKSGQKPKPMAPASLITKFTKVLTEEDRLRTKLGHKQSDSTSIGSDDPVPLPITDSPVPSPVVVKTKKRIQPTLIDLAITKTKSQSP